MPDIVINVDNREKAPLNFPAHLTILSRGVPPSHPPTTQSLKIRFQNCTLPVADYVLDEEPGICYTDSLCVAAGIVERKASVDEIATNCLSPVRRPRFIAQLRRMRERWQHPLLLLEGGLQKFLADSPRGIESGPVLDALLDISLQTNVPIIPLGCSNRNLIGEYVARYLYACRQRGA
jgi:ERCC4-type nuclease